MKKLKLQCIAFSFKTDAEMTELELNELRESLRECMQQFTKARNINVYATKEEIDEQSSNP